MRTSRTRYPPDGWAEQASLQPLARACLSGRLARIRYRAADGEVTEREVAVLGLGWRHDGWLFAAFCQLRGSFRLFRADRVLSATVTRRPAPATPGHFDARAFASAELVEPPNAPTRRVAIRLTLPIAQVAGALLPTALAEQLADGGQLCHLRTTSLEGIAGLVLSLGRFAQATSPPELRSIVEGFSAALARQREREVPEA
ncbi:helix-turn-helix transcriptional regulator [Anaeromyxobacter paludicola]|uniref:WYL domain-containing protein n=1 Tax=Anaeromyxobacter paludicola TaxID=2918171 RepID=A0ABM7X9T6_9BACT|nr:WYL domain-containing protein [Anaeromyxobacter paludicola]BDG08607.1 hypothetical protein AMPC_17200 [Anaeromyxobacter paludicola]